jgi:hypothetical protein
MTVGEGGKKWFFCSVGKRAAKMQPTRVNIALHDVFDTLRKAIYCLFLAT